jgi:hypothetical protein
MPRVSEKAQWEGQIEEDIVALTDKTLNAYALGDATMAETTQAVECIDDMRTIFYEIATSRYLLPRVYGVYGAGRHQDDVLGNLMGSFPESAFQACFRMKRHEFWAVVDRLTAAAPPGFWGPVKGIELLFLPVCLMCDSSCIARHQLTCLRPTWT